MAVIKGDNVVEGGTGVDEEERKRIGIGEKSEDTDNNQSFLYALSVPEGTDRDLIKKA